MTTATLTYHLPQQHAMSLLPIRLKALKETGTIEKLNGMYGVVQCCERNARLNFTLSQCINATILRSGDEVQFEMTYDAKSGKPTASKVEKIASNYELVSETKQFGQVVKPAINVRSEHRFGQLSYEKGGEFYFPWYSVDDIERIQHPLIKGDNVQFLLEVDKESGKQRARKISAIKELNQSGRMKGVVRKLKNEYGFIERADCTKEIFFRKESIHNFNVKTGDSVEFDIERTVSPSGSEREIAKEMKLLPPGSVVFEDVLEGAFKGTVISTVKGEHRLKPRDRLAGRIIAMNNVELKYCDSDMCGDYTMHLGDVVHFNIAIDRRTGDRKAANIQLSPRESFKRNNEKRETGVICAVKNGNTYGFIKCADREARIFYHRKELIEPFGDPRCDDEVEFTVQIETDGSMVATRVILLPQGSVSFEMITNFNSRGVVMKAPQTHRAQAKNKSDDIGEIRSQNGNLLSYVVDGIADVNCMPMMGDHVAFDVVRQKFSGFETAVAVRPVAREHKNRHFGFIATLKESFGFIEFANHQQEIFFHYSSYPGDPSMLELGDEVEFVIVRTHSKISADQIRRLTKGTLSSDVLCGEEIYQGRIIRPLRIVDPDQSVYPGKIRMGLKASGGGEAPEFEFGVTSLKDLCDFLQVGDVVDFQLAKAEASEQDSSSEGTALLALLLSGRRAVNITRNFDYSNAKVQRARIEVLKERYGFLNYEAIEGKKLFFHMSEAHDPNMLRRGDEVEFIPIKSQKNGRFAACSVKRVDPTAAESPPP